MCVPKSSPYWKSNSSWPLFSTGIASRRPDAFASLAMSAPNCSSTRTPAESRGTPSSAARLAPSWITFLASEILTVSSALGSPATPKNFFWNEPR
jgi:hypothetical protein